MSTTRGLRAPTIARAAAPVLLLLVAMAIPPFAAVATLVLGIGAVVAARREAPVAWAWAAMVPATALATVRWVSGVVPAALEAACDPSGPPRIAWAIVEAVVVLGTFTALAVLLRTRRASVGLRRPARRAVRNAVLGFGVFAIGGLVVVSNLRGGVPLPAGDGSSTASFIVTALVGAAAIAVAEELAFRGVAQHWLARTTGEWPAVVVQGVAYGLWVAAVGWGPLVGIVAVGAGVVAGVLTMRTNSILTVLAWHAGIAVPLLAVMVCVPMTGRGGEPRSAGAEWDPEIVLEEARVRALISGQFPDASLEGLAPLSTGWDNALWVTGEGIAFRFPRRAIAVPGVAREIAVLPLLAPRLPLPIPVPEWIGRPADDYPWPFFGARLLPGTEIADAPMGAAREGFAVSLAGFLRALHDPGLVAALGSGLARDPMGRADMTRRVPRTRERFEALASLGLWTAPSTALELLGEAATLPPSGEEAIVHGDLHVRHVLVGPDGRPAAVIDWGDLAVADPSVDLALYWSQLDGPARAAFREAYGAQRLTPARLLRARVLALFLGAALAAYAHDTGNDPLLRTTLEGLDRTLQA